MKKNIIMKKSIIIATFVIVALCQLSCENLVAQNSNNNKMGFGFRVGRNHADLNYSSGLYDMYTHKDHWQNQYGFFLNCQVSKHFAIRPEVDYIGRGVSLKFEDITYKMDAKYVDLRLPLVLSIAPHSLINPYLFVAPEFCLARDGEITYKSNQTGKISADISDANISQFDVAVIGGIGIELPINIGQFRMSLAAEGGYSIGFFDTFSKDELSCESTLLNPSPYILAPESSRNNNGIEVVVSISMPFSNFQVK
jgi:hypothetical protein